MAYDRRGRGVRGKLTPGVDVARNQRGLLQGSDTAIKGNYSNITGKVAT
jgi:hypothetical protein